MSEKSPYEILGITDSASFEEIQEAKNQLIQEYRDDSKVIENIETAYDAIIMERLRMRQEGKIKVPDRIRFPERTVEVPPSPPSISFNNSPPWLQRFIDTPSSNDILLPAGIFAALGTIAVFISGSQIPLILVIGVFANVYFLNRKEQKFGRALLMTIVGLLLGVGLGTGIVSILSGANLTLALAGDKIASIATFVLFWLISSFLR